jgi:hypothetical protein
MPAKLKGMVVVAMFISPGVKAGASGFVIVNGKLKRVPPRGPAFQQLQAAVQAVAKGGKGGSR